MSLSAKRFGDLSVQMVNIIRDEIGQLNGFAVVPDLLGRIELRCIGGMPFRLEPVGMLFSEPAHRLAMDAVAIQHEVADRFQSLSWGCPPVVADRFEQAGSGLRLSA